MSKSPIRDYARLIDNIRTIKKEPQLTYQPPSTHSYFKDPYISTDKTFADLKMKLELSLKHNTRLLDQNSMLSQMVNNLRFELKGAQQQIGALQASINDQLINSQNQRNQLMQQLEVKQKLHQSQLGKLLEEISNLHSQKNNMQISKNKQIQNLKDNYEKQTVNYLQNMKNAQNNAKQIYQKQILCLKQLLERSQHQKQNIICTNKLEINKLFEKIKIYEADIKHQKNLFNIEIQDLKNKFLNDLNLEKKNLGRQKQIQNTAYQFSIKRLKNQIAQKNASVDILSRKLAQIQQSNQFQLIHVKKQKQSLLLEIANLQIQKNNSISRQKAKLNQINKQQIQNLISMNQTHIDSLNGQIKRLKQLIDCKTYELRKLIQQNSNIKQSLILEKQLIIKQNEQLKKTIKKLEAENLEQLQQFKIKMARLFHSDIQALSSFYQNQIANLTVKSKELEKINQGNKQKLYKSILQNDQIRKTFQIEISKQKSRVQDLKIKLAALDVQHKEQILSIGTKMNLTSQTLIRQTEQKNKSATFFQEQKRKFQSLVNSKDKQISQLLESIHKLKKMHESQIDVLRTQKKDLISQVQELQKDKNRIKSTLEQQIARKDEKLKQTIIHSTKDTEQLKQLSKKNQQVENQNIKLQKQCQHLIRENRSMAQQLGLKKGFIQTLQLESCAAIQDQKNKIKVIMNANQISLKQYFQEKVQSKDKDIKTLQTLLAEKQQDIRDLIIKYNALEKRLENILDSQSKLIQFQQKVKNIGMDNNLIKNLAQLFRNRES